MKPPTKPKLRYKEMPELTQSTSYLKHIPEVYPQELHFDWQETDYEVTQSSRNYVISLNKQLEASNQPPLSEKDFTKIIDVFEKLRYSGNSQSLQAMVEGFFYRMKDYAHDQGTEGPTLVERVHKQIVEQVYKSFWQPEQENRKYHKLVRKFWENPDFNDSMQLAFKKNDT